MNKWLWFSGFFSLGVALEGTQRAEAWIAFGAIAVGALLIIISAKPKERRK